ncbi:MAG: hypothetical protein ACYC3X_15385 [Pirellulaceae bacterium]
MTTGKDLDDITARVDKKRAEAAKVQADLAALEMELRKTAEVYWREKGLSIPGQAASKAPSSKPSRTGGTVNAAAKAAIIKLIGKKKVVQIKKPEKEELAAEAKCSVADIEQTLKAEFTAHPIGTKGRKSQYGLKD